MEFNITLNYGRDNYLSEFSKKTLQDRYLLEGEGEHMVGKRASFRLNR